MLGVLGRKFKKKEEEEEERNCSSAHSTLLKIFLTNSD
jgi:hypothetical protein